MSASMVDPKTLTLGQQRTRNFYEGGTLYDLGDVVSGLTVAQRHDLMWRIHSAVVDVINSKPAGVQPAPTPKPRRYLPEGFRVIEGGAALVIVFPDVLIVQPGQASIRLRLRRGATVPTRYGRALARRLEACRP